MARRKKKIVIPKILKNPSRNRIRVIGPSGKQYDFEPGKQLEVGPEDYDYLLSLKHKGGRGCCGGSGSTDNSYFEEV